jgi:hypothetical protein
MFLGHFGLAMAAKRVAPRMSLGVAMLAAQFLDALWPVFVLAGSLIVELVLFIAGIVIFLRTSRARDRIGSLGFWALVVLLGIIYFGAVFGPAPPSTNAVAGSVLIGWLFFAFAWWFDRHREPASP